MGVWSFIVAAFAAVVAIVIAFLILWKRDVIKSAFSGLVASLIVLTGSLGSQSVEFEASIPKTFFFGIPIEVTKFVVSGTPENIWIIAFLTIAGLLAWFGKLINDRC
jgi:Na+/proline symporter